MKPFFYFLTLLVALTSCRVWHVADQNVQTFELKSEIIADDSATVALILPYKTQLDEQMNVEIGRFEQEMTKAKPESLLTNWFADALQTQTAVYYGKPIDFAVSNYGGIRLPSLPAGVVTKRGIFELMPFDNALVVVEIADTTVQKLFAHMAESQGWPISSNVQYSIKQQRAQDIRINGKPIEAGRTYTVSVSDYLANGGDNCSFLSEGKRTDLNVLIRDALIAFIEAETKNGRTLNSNLDGRLKYVE
jgi:2',3'-cyclic-nucleotide 2'-phosphodiesterase (5'-nucleotidase family)